MKRYLLFAIVALFAACTSDFEDINSNVYGIKEEEIKVGGLAYGAPFMLMQQLVIPIGSPDKATGPGNDLQNTDLISSGNYVGYFGNNNNWNFNIEATWNFSDSRMNYAFDNFYSKMFRSWNDIYKNAKDSQEPYEQQVLAMANIVKNIAWLRATDVFGPIVFSKAGSGSIAPELDSQHDVYKGMLKELADAREVLSKAPNKIMDKYDVIYNGATDKWIKLSNSIMLRMAVRSHFKDKALAQQYIDLALDPANGGVIEDVGDEARIQSSAKLPLLNSIIASIDYQETRMGTTIWSYLVGYNDPRIGSYFNKGTVNGRENFYAVAPTNKIPKRTGQNSPEFASTPKVSPSSPLYWMRASEVQFLKAEAALFGLLAGSARQYYEAGVAMSFKENGVGDATEYLSRFNLPRDIDSYEYAPFWDSYTSMLSKGNVSPRWDDLNHESTLNQQEQQFQKIITQKYIALYPNAVEAWTEYRRTGFPYVGAPYDTDAPKRIGCATCLVPERFKFSPSEYSSNPNMSKVPSLLGGEDIGSTKQWWVRSNRPKQP